MRVYESETMRVYESVDGERRIYESVDGERRVYESVDDARLWVGRRCASMSR